MTRTEGCSGGGKGSGKLLNGLGVEMVWAMWSNNGLWSVRPFSLAPPLSPRRAFPQSAVACD